MARIRSIKPQFWTSEQVAECSPNARLLFIGLWNFCDDYGIHPASVRRAKMEIFPSDDFCSADIRRMIDELIANNLIEEYEIAETQYWRVTGWDKHQRPDTKTGLYPMPDGQVGGKIRRQTAEDTKPIRRTVGEHSPPEKEKEKEKEKEEKPSSASQPSPDPNAPPLASPKQPKGSRLPPDWKLPKPWGEWAMEDRGLSAEQVRTEADKFADYWRAKPGKDAVKLDWLATWRNWVRNAAERIPAGDRSPSGSALFAGVI